MCTILQIGTVHTIMEQGVSTEKMPAGRRQHVRKEKRKNMDLQHLDPNPEGSSEGTTSVLREAMESQKTKIRLKGDMGLDDSDPDLVMIWSRAVTPDNADCLVCWKVTDRQASEMKDMVAQWDQFVVLDSYGKPMGTARDYFLIK